jgi:hypothetical protein
MAGGTAAQVAKIRLDKKINPANFYMKESAWQFSSFVNP